MQNADMADTEATRRLRDLANAAATVVQAAEEAPGRTLESVDTALSGPATVVVDEGAVDIVLHEDDVTVHVRANAA